MLALKRARWATASSTSTRSSRPGREAPCGSCAAKLGVGAFGLNWFELGPNVVGREHDESDTGQEEVYVVVRGTGVWRIDGDEIRARRDRPARRRGERAPRGRSGGPDDGGGRGPTGQLRPARTAGVGRARGRLTALTLVHGSRRKFSRSPAIYHAQPGSAASCPAPSVGRRARRGSDATKAGTSGACASRSYGRFDERARSCSARRRISAAGSSRASRSRSGSSPSANSRRTFSFARAAREAPQPEGRNSRAASSPHVSLSQVCGTAPPPIGWHQLPGGLGLRKAGGPTSPPARRAQLRRGRWLRRSRRHVDVEINRAAARSLDRVERLRRCSRARRSPLPLSSVGAPL